MQANPPITWNNGMPSVALATVYGSSTSPPISSSTSVYSPTYSSSPTPMSSNNVKLIIASSVVGGVVFLSFVAYVIIRLCRGGNLVDILKLRPRRPVQLDEDAPPPNPFAEGVFIHRTQRYSVRSYRYPARLSICSTKSRAARDASSRTPTTTGKSTPDSLSKQYAEQYLIKPPTAKESYSKRNPVAQPDDYPPAPSDNKVMQSFLFNASGENNLSKPQMALVRTDSASSSPITPPLHHSAPELVAGDKASSRHLTVTERPLTAPTSKRVSRFTEGDKERWSWTNSEAPPTPKYRLERAPSSEPENPNRLTMKSIPEAEGDVVALPRTSETMPRRTPNKDQKPRKSSMKNTAASRPAEVPVAGSRGRRLSKAGQHHQDHARVPSLGQIIKNLSAAEVRAKEDEVMLTQKRKGS